MAKAGKWLIFGIALLVTWLVLNAAIPSLGVVGILPALLITSGILVTAGALGFKIVPMKIKPVWGLAILAFGLFLGGMLGSVLSGFQGLVPSAAPAATLVIPGTTTTTASVSVDECRAGISPEILDSAATVDFNAYDMAADSPLSAAVDTTVQIYKAKSIAEAGQGNFNQQITDTSASATTGFNVGDVISVAGGNTSAVTDVTAYYVEKLDGFCIKQARPNINLNAHRIQSLANLETTIYDSTASTALSAGAAGVDYTIALGASEETTVYYKLKNAGANSDFWIGGIATATFTNMSEVKPGGDDAGKFATMGITPLFAKDLAVVLNSTGEQNMTRSYSIYRLNTPEILKEFQSRTYQIKVLSSSNNPMGAAGLASQSGFAICAVDVGWVKGSDSKMYLDVWDHTSSESNIGVSEDLNRPNGLDACGMVVAT